MLTTLRKKMKGIMITVAVLFVATMFYGLGYSGLNQGGAATPAKNSIATLNGKEIDHKRYELTFKRMLSQDKEAITPDKLMYYQTIALDQIIDFSLMLKDAKKNFRVSGGELNATIDQVITMNKIPNKDALKQTLKNSGQDFGYFQDTLKEEILVSKMVNKIRGSVTMTPDDLREVKASHILIMPRGTDKKSDFEARTRIEDFLVRLKKGDNFSDIAKKFSDDRGSAANGGDLGFFTTGAMVPEFEKAVFLLRPGQLSEIVKTSYGYHIIKVTDTRLRKIDTKGKDLSEVVLAEKQDLAVKKWMFTLRSKAKIEINDALIKANTFMLQGKLNDALSVYNQALIADPNNPYIYYFLAGAYVASGNNDLALMQYQKATDLAGGDPGFLIVLGNAYIKMGKKEIALQQYRRASMIAGDNKELHVALKDIFTKIASSSDAAKETAEIKRIEKKEKFEAEIQQRLK